jgi:prepilin-type N-terminal cleavage/methylation domain-containing protein
LHSSFVTAAEKSAGRSRKARFHASSGFTLIEIMVAVAILGIAMTTIHYGQAQSLRAQARSQNVTLATMKASEKLDEVLTTGRFELPAVGSSEEGVFDPPYDFLHWTLRVEENEIMPEMMRDVHLTVSWEAESEKRSRSSRTEGTGGRSIKVCLYVANLQ